MKKLFALLLCLCLMLPVFAVAEDIEITLWTYPIGSWGNEEVVNGIIANFNMVPGDTRKPTVTSGVRMGTPSLTSMGMVESDMDKVGEWILRVLNALPNSEEVEKTVRAEIAEYCKQFKIPGIRD